MTAADAVGADGHGLAPGGVLLRLENRKGTIELTSLSLSCHPHPGHLLLSAWLPCAKAWLILFPRAWSSDSRPSIWVRPECGRFTLRKGQTPAAFSEYGKEVIGFVGLAAWRQR